MSVASALSLAAALAAAGVLAIALLSGDLGPLVLFATGLAVASAAATVAGGAYEHVREGRGLL